MTVCYFLIQYILTAIMYKEIMRNPEKKLFIPSKCLKVERPMENKKHWLYANFYF